MLHLDLKDHAERFLNRLVPKHRGQVARKIASLQMDPYPPDSKQLKKSMHRGADIGEYRIIYRVAGDILHVPLIGKRKDDDVYRPFPPIDS